MRRPEECFTTLQSGDLLYHSKANNGHAGVSFLINRKWKAHIVTISRIAEFGLCITKRYKIKIVQVYAPTTSYSEEDINNFKDIDETLGKPNHYDSDGRLQCSNREKNKPNGNGTGQI